MHHVRRGQGRPLLMIHGLGGSHASWDPLVEALAAQREVIAVDLPGFGQTPPLAGEQSVAALTDALERFQAEHGLDRVDMVGSSMGARMVLELVRRGKVGNAVALDPGGFWTDRQAKIFGASVAASVKLVKLLAPVMPALTGNPVTRTALFAQFSAAPWKLDQNVVLAEMRSFASSPVIEEVLRNLARGPRQEGAPRGSAPGQLIIGWGRRDLVTLPSQAERASRLFPDARLHWFEACGHFPHWDQPEQATRVILEATAEAPLARAA